MKSIFFIISLLATVAVFAQPTNRNAFTIAGSFADMDNGSIVTVYHPASQSVIATDTAKNKKFLLKGNVPFEGLGRVVITKDKSTTPIDLFFGNDAIKITGLIKSPKGIVVTGSKSHTVFNNFLKEFEPSFKKLNELNAQSASNTDEAARQQNKTAFAATVENIEKKMDAFVPKYKNSVVTSFCLYVTKDLFKDKAAEVKDRMDLLTETAKASIYYDALAKDIDAMLFGSIGSAAVDFTQADTAGKPISLSSFKGKYVLLDFWASWCGPCRVENPNVVAAFNKFKQKNFTVLGVSLDRPGKKEDWIRAIKEDNLYWTNVSDLKFWQNEVAQLYKVGSIPQNYLISPDGKIIGKNLRGEALDAKLCELLGCN